MNIDLTPLNLGKDHIDINENIYFSKDKLKDTEILDML